MKALEKDRTRRYETTNGLARDIERHLNSEPVVARPPSTVYRFQKLVRRNKLAFAAVGAVAAALVFGLTVSMYHAVRATKAESKERSLREEAQRERDAARALLWRSHLDQARSLRESDRVGRRAAGLEAIERAAGIRPSLEVRNEAIATLALTEFAVRKQWAGFPEGTTAAAIDPEHQFYPRADGQGRISVRDVASDQEMASLRGPAGSCLRMQFGPGGRYLAAGFDLGNHGEMWVWEWRSGTILRKRTLKYHDRASFDFHPSGNSLAVCSFTETNAIGHLDLLPDATLGLFPVDHGSAQIRFSPDGRFLAVEFNWNGVHEARNGRVSVFDTRDYKLVCSFEGESQVSALCWHPNSELLIVGRWNPWLHVYDVSKGESLDEWGRHELHVVSCVFDSSGDRLATRTYDGTLSIWDVAQKRVIFSTHAQGRKTWLTSSHGGTESSTK